MLDVSGLDPRTHALLRAMPVGLLAYDDEGRLVCWSDDGARWFGSRFGWTPRAGSWVEALAVVFEAADVAVLSRAVEVLVRGGAPREVSMRPFDGATPAVTLRCAFFAAPGAPRLVLLALPGDAPSTAPAPRSVHVEREEVRRVLTLIDARDGAPAVEASITLRPEAPEPRGVHLSERSTLPPTLAEGDVARLFEALAAAPWPRPGVSLVVAHPGRRMRFAGDPDTAARALAQIVTLACATLEDGGAVHLDAESDAGGARVTVRAQGAAGSECPSEFSLLAARRDLRALGATLRVDVAPGGPRTFTLYFVPPAP
jgi:hypothetical protein